jgi:hypothetical protein
VKGVNQLLAGKEGAEVEVVAPSLRFAIKLAERTSMYRAAAASARSAKLKGQERRRVMMEGIVTAKKEKEMLANMNHILPVEIVSLVLSFYRGCEVEGETKSGIWGSGGLAEGEAKTPTECQSTIDGLPISKRKEHVKYLRRAREVCKLWCQLSSAFIVGLRAGEMLESGRGQRRYGAELWGPRAKGFTGGGATERSAT